MKKWQHQQQFKTRFSLIKNSESFEGCRSRSAFRVRKTQSSIIPDTSFLERVMNELSYNFIFQISFVTFFALQGWRNAKKWCKRKDWNVETLKQRRRKGKLSDNKITFIGWVKVTTNWNVIETWDLRSNKQNYFLFLFSFALIFIIYLNYWFQKKKVLFVWKVSLKWC